MSDDPDGELSGVRLPDRATVRVTWLSDVDGTCEEVSRPEFVSTLSLHEPIEMFVLGDYELATSDPAQIASGEWVVAAGC